MRIVGGRWRGRSLLGPVPPGTRPTADRLRETLFNLLAHAHGDPVPGARVLDLFAGTGALGFEALSRGAAFALQVEAEPDAGRLIRRNSAALGCGGTSALLRQDATRLGPAGALAPFDLVFADPPYGRELARPALLACAAGGWLRAGALAVVEEKGDGFAFPEGFAEQDRRRYGGTALAFGRFAGLEGALTED